MGVYLRLSIVFGVVAATACGGPQADPALPKYVYRGPATLVTFAPPGISDRHLGRPLNDRFEFLVGPQGQTLFPSATQTESVPEASFEFGAQILETNQAIEANVRAWVLSTSAGHSSSMRYAVFRVFQLAEVHRVDDTTEMRSVPSDATWYLQKIYYGRIYEHVLYGDASRFHAGVKASFARFGGEIDGFRARYQLQEKIHARGLKPKGAAMFVRSRDELVEHYSRDEDFEKPAIFVEYRRIPNAQPRNPEELAWEEPKEAMLRYGVRVDASIDEWQVAPDLVVKRGDTVSIEVSGTITIDDGAKPRRADGRCEISGVETFYCHGALLVRLGFGDPVFTGRSSIHTIADDGGPVAFKVSDSNHLDNTGLYDVVITVIPETLLPPVIR